MDNPHSTHQELLQTIQECQSRGLDHSAAWLLDAYTHLPTKPTKSSTSGKVIPQVSLHSLACQASIRKGNVRMPNGVDDGDRVMVYLELFGMYKVSGVNAVMDRCRSDTYLDMKNSLAARAPPSPDLLQAAIKAVEKYPNDAYLLSLLGYMKRRAKDSSAAALYFEQAIKANPVNPQPWTSMLSLPIGMRRIPKLNHWMADLVKLELICRNKSVATTKDLDILKRLQASFPKWKVLDILAERLQHGRPLWAFDVIHDCSREETAMLAMEALLQDPNSVDARFFSAIYVDKLRTNGPGTDDQSLTSKPNLAIPDKDGIPPLECLHTKPPVNAKQFLHQLGQRFPPSYFREWRGGLEMDESPGSKRSRVT